MNERQSCDSEMCKELLSWEAADHDSPAHGLGHVYFTLLLGCSDTTDRSICSLQFVEGFMDSLPQSSALETPEKFVSLCSLRS